MAQLLVTVLGEGSSDDALIPIVEWVLQHPELGLLPDADILSTFISPPQISQTLSLPDRIGAAFREYPCDLLFVHHDSDGPSPDSWRETILSAAGDSRTREPTLPPVIPVVPVREMEAWVLLDEPAIRRAVAVPRGTSPLGLPRFYEVEHCMDPKLVLREALHHASGLAGRRRAQIDAVRARDVADLTETFEALRQLPAFRAFEADVQRVIDEQRWPERLPG